MLWRQVSRAPRPEHIAVILDGNRRWALRRALPPWKGHEAGAAKVRNLLEWCHRLGVRTLTLYAFSMENFRRSEEEVSRLMELAGREIVRALEDGLVHRYKIRVRALGRLDSLPDGVRGPLKMLEEATKGYNDFHLNVAVAYSGRAEIVDAVRAIAEEVRSGVLEPEDVDEKTIERHLYTASLERADPDLIIRTSGEERLSGFLLWQGAYSELAFLDVNWPDFRLIDLLRAIRTYQSRTRRFGR